EIAEIKLKDTNTDDIESCARSVEGTARSMGVDIVD
ncbi:MAG: 50S ribosomal protein L11, partial [Sandaracinaceae bacterium]|nr:50S ribosomal protein L11 [Sandaracinaceae bacterium]